jgi:integrase
MPRASTGQVVVRERKDGRVFALRFRAYGERQYVTLGTDAEGWTPKRAEDALRHTLADVERGIWQRARPAPAPEPEKDPTFHEFASEWFEAKRQEIRPNTASSYHSDLKNHLLPFFAKHPLSEITIKEVDRYRNQQVREGKLKARSINMHLALLAQILELAVEYEEIDLDRNPASGRRRRLTATRARSVHLDTAEQISTLLEAAGSLDASSRTDGRRAAIAVMVCAGLRAEEVGALDWRDIDLANGRLHVGRAKTAAGVREVDLLAILRDELLALKAASRQTAANDPVFIASTGRRRDRHNLRQRVVAPAVRAADVLLTERGANPLPAGLSPHKLRHTFASILVALGNDPAYVMGQLGHTHPAFTLRVYTHMMRRDPGERDRLRALIDGDPLGTSPVLVPKQADIDPISTPIRGYSNRPNRP